MHQGIAAVHGLAAIVVGVLVVRLWNPGDYIEALPGVLLVALLLAIAWGLWWRRAWGRVLALIVHWPCLVGAVVLLPACLYVLLFVPPGEIAVLHFFALLALVFLSPALLLSASTLWYLQWRKVR
jgi:hypothetical protein